jgi:beta-lactamase regulating signal transducer with metallopeptidase domain
MILERLVHLLSALLTVNLVRGLAVFAVAYAITTVVRGLSPVTRHMIWFVVILSFLLLPLAWLTLPAVQVGVRIPVEPGSAFRLAAAPALSKHDYACLVDKGLEYARLAGQGRGVPASTLQLILTGAWFSGIGWLIARWLTARNKLKRLAATARKARCLQHLADALAAEAGVPCKVTVSHSPRCSIPFTFGVRRPVILVPAVAAAWPHSWLRSVLTHELAHVRRRDVFIQSIAYAICVLFWFIPPLWIAYSLLLREAETCCDQQVINRGIRGSEYARNIVGLLRASRGHILFPTMSSTLGRKRMLKARIRKVLSLRPARLGGGARGAVRVLAVCLCCLVPLLAVTCATGPKAAVRPDDPLFGTWVNAKYEGNADFSAKMVMSPDGRELDYDRIASTEPEWEGNFNIEETWIDAEGNHWHKGRGTWWDPTAKHMGQADWYFVHKINPSGTVLESVSSQTGYPEEMGPLGGFYGTWNKQE